MEPRIQGEQTTEKCRTTVERPSECEIVVTRTFDAPANIVYAAWTRSDLFQRWWIPKSTGLKLLSCEVDARTGGTYRLVFDLGQEESVAMHGRYLEVTPNSRLVWTNDESEGGSVTTVTFEEKEGKTLLVLHELYATKEDLEANAGMEEGLGEAFDQLDELLHAKESR